ncbi:permease prefix domain 1-containing protein [Micromonospora sp. C28SCA-DRY-2]|uniref:permease prefix domain 1-containing protein n=1 Tax=Micromonospora sp. C28SCA-DRY-2 TaxID=3059522 RepID=UPI0026753BB5|nr:permease prefix domain 1-containing protein [Micromonospora sp. C28SCA-DRY-2]MDO3705126.1 permease prefix domain 1-containing protein [Micromonospora sp. C28SCA-DRY-2]
MTARDPAGPGHDPIEEHLAALAVALHGPARVKARMLTEARDGLADAAAALAGGATPDDHAARQAVRDFGSVDEVAPAFQRELTVAQARHTARAVVLAVPFLLACWALVTVVGGDQGRHAPRVAQTLAAHLGGVAAAAALLAGAALAVTGALARRLPTPHRLPLMVAWAGTTATAALATSALTLAVAATLAGSWPLGALIAVLALAVHARIAASARACRRCARAPLVATGEG